MVSLSIPFCSVQRVYFDDLDALNILHNMRYLLFIERARGELLDALGFRWDATIERNPDKIHVIAAHDIQYLRPVRQLGDLCVALTPRRLGTSSLIVEARVQSMDGSTMHARGTSRMVRLDPATQRPCSWSPRFRETFAALVVADSAAESR
jgi:acyl-CoA thioester hydrolase